MYLLSGCKCSMYFLNDWNGYIGSSLCSGMINETVLSVSVILSQFILNFDHIPLLILLVELHCEVIFKHLFYVLTAMPAEIELKVKLYLSLYIFCPFSGFV